MKVPSDRYSQDVMGMPCFAATEKLLVNVSGEDMSLAVAADDENCAIALACKRQLQTPYTSIGRFRSDIALPHPEGVTKLGFGDTKWAVIRFRNTPSAREVIIAADTASASAAGQMVELRPPNRGDEPKMQKRRNEYAKVSKGKTKKRALSGRDQLTDLGVRILTGQRKR